MFVLGKNWNKSDAYGSPRDSKTYWESQGYWFEPYPDGDYTVYYYAAFEDLCGDYFDNAHTIVNNDGTVQLLQNKQ